MIYVSGLICKDVLAEEGNVLSAIRITDKITVDVPPWVDLPNAPTAQPIPIFVLLFVNSDEPEQFDLELTPVRPNGSRGKTAVFHVESKSGNEGNRFRIVVNVDTRIQGLIWFEVKISGELKLRLPLEIRHDRLPDSPVEPPSQTRPETSAD